MHASPLERKIIMRALRLFINVHNFINSYSGDEVGEFIIANDMINELKDIEKAELDAEAARQESL